MSERIVIYTAQVGYTDRIFLREPEPFTCDWIAFKYVPVEKSRQLSREIKILGHKWLPRRYNIYVWIDSTEFFIDDVRPYVEAYLANADWCTLTEDPKYGATLYESAWADVKSGRNSESAVERQLARYRSEHVPVDTPVYQNSMIMRRMTPEVMRVSEAWWQEYNLSTDPEIGFGDQAAFAYVAWKSGIKVNRVSVQDRAMLIGQVPFAASFTMSNEGAKCE